MRSTSWRIFAPGAALFAALALATTTPAAEAKPARKKILYITATGGFHHSACEYSIPIFKKAAEATGRLEVTAPKGTELLNPRDLARFDAIVFSNTTGGLGKFPATEPALQALVDAVKGGKAFIGVHAATDTLADWKPYPEMIGASFNGHPWTKKVTIDIEDPAHPCASMLPSPWVVDDEIYSMRNYDRSKLHVIMSMDIEKESNKGNREDRDYPIAWCKPYGKGRVFYTSLGHKHSVWDDPTYQKHLIAGVLWALGIESESDKGHTHPLHIGHAKPKGKWTPIFDGKTLAFGSEWETSDDPAKTRAHWTVRPGGILQGEGDGSSHLYYRKKKYHNFEFRADVCINRDGNSGMYFRCVEGNLRNGRWKNWPTGYEAQVNNGWDPDPKKSGTFYPKPTLWAADIERVLGYTKEKDDGNFWFNQHIIAVDDHFVIKLDGKVVVDHYDGRFPEGYFAFQLHHHGTVVKFKNIEVRELD